MSGKCNVKFILLIIALHYDSINCACSCTCDGQEVKTTMLTTSPRPTRPEVSHAAAQDTCTVGDPQEGYRFGTQVDSRIEYSNLPSSQSGGYNLAIDFRTFDKHGGLIFYAEADSKPEQFLAVYMKDALLHVASNCGEKTAQVSSNQTYNDAKWHQMRLVSIEGYIEVTVDNQKVGESNVTCIGQKMLTKPFYFGGLKKVTARYNESVGFYQPFQGCLQGLKSNGQYVTAELQRVKVLRCIDNVEHGLYFEPYQGNQSSYLKVVNHFQVGREIGISMEVKPQHSTGLLLSVHGKNDYLILEMLESEVIVKVENGRGPFQTSYVLEKKSLCDGRWHTIHVFKSHHVVTVGVDGYFSDVGSGQSDSTDTKYGLYIGGHERDIQTVRGTQTRQGFVGCIRNIKIKDNLITIHNNASSRGVHIGVCPLN